VLGILLHGHLAMETMGFGVFPSDELSNFNYPVHAFSSFCFSRSQQGVGFVVTGVVGQ